MTAGRGTFPCRRWAIQRTKPVISNWPVELAGCSFQPGAAPHSRDSVKWTPWCAAVFEYHEENSKTPGKVRAQDMRHILLCLPFLLHYFVRPEVEEYNTQHPESEPLVDSSSELIDVTQLLLTWYRLFRRSSPSKDGEDMRELTELAHWYLNISEYN